MHPRPAHRCLPVTSGLLGLFFFASIGWADPHAKISEAVREVFDLRPGAIVRDLGLNTLSAQSGGFYRRLAVYGHMGRTDPEVTWEQTDIASRLT